jgi:hypothetical protein
VCVCMRVVRVPCALATRCVQDVQSKMSLKLVRHNPTVPDTVYLPNVPDSVYLASIKWNEASSSAVAYVTSPVDVVARPSASQLFYNQPCPFPSRAAAATPRTTETENLFSLLWRVAGHTYCIPTVLWQGPSDHLVALLHVKGGNGVCCRRGNRFW